MQNTVVAKFGGTSLANAPQMAKAINIVQGAPERTHVVVSAPGTCPGHPDKVTDLLLAWHAARGNSVESLRLKSTIENRFLSIVRGLRLELDLEDTLRGIAQDVTAGASEDFVASRGEFLNAKIMAKALGFEFVDAAWCIKLQGAWHNQYLTYDLVCKYAGEKPSVIPGFYGTDIGNKGIKTFARGGSDITGSIVAHALKAMCYENWTDVDGILAADPRIVENPRTIPVMTYREVRELSYMGAGVVQTDALVPVEQARINTHIYNTNNPGAYGTLIVGDDMQPHRPGTIVGVAGRKDFLAISLEKALMNHERGYLATAAAVFKERGVSIDHVPSSIDSLSFIVQKSEFCQKDQKTGERTDVLPALLEELRRKCEPDNLEVDSVALIAVVGQAMSHVSGVARKPINALSDAGINIHILNQGASETNIIFGVDVADYEQAIRTIYDRCIATQAEPA